MYDLSPITVTITEKRRNFFHFLTRLCAVLGGTFALSGEKKSLFFALSIAIYFFVILQVTNLFHFPFL